MPSSNPLVLGLALFGGAFLAVKLSSFVRLLLSLFLLPGKSLRTYGTPGKTWALVTGASDGIGLEFATQLAQAEYNIMLVSRTESKLKSLASNLESTYNIQTKALAIDFASASLSDWTALSDLIASHEISILINNVGLSHSIPVPFAQTPPTEMQNIITINCTATLRVTSLALPGMLSRQHGQQKQRSLILTMGSFGGLVPTPLLATYSGSKAFLQAWSSALGAELAPRGIDVCLVQSYLVTSAMSKIRRASASVPSPHAFVRAALRHVGRSGGAQGFAYSCTPYWSHAVMQWVVGTFAGFSWGPVVRINMKIHEGIRKRALRKMEREAGKKSS